MAAEDAAKVSGKPLEIMVVGRRAAGRAAALSECKPA
jgi:hypothetical protein